VQSVRRDATIAGICGLCVLVGLSVLGAGRLLWHPFPVAVGVCGALLVEAAFLAETPVRRLWARPGVQAVCVVGLLAGGAAAAAVSGPWVLAAVGWGIATYYLLLAVTVLSRRLSTDEAPVQ
jgi:hypothetical protein